MDSKLLKSSFKEYKKKFAMILDEYGEKDGFVINGVLWWDFYKRMIKDCLAAIENGSFTIDDAMRFYKLFGFGPKLYNRTFVENGLENIKRLFVFLADDSIGPEVKIKEVVEDPDSEHAFRGVGINFVTLFLTSCFPEKYVQWNAQTDGALKLLDCYPLKARGVKKSEFYVKINNICLNIMNELELESLTHVDNYLFCLNKGYIGNERHLVKRYDKQIRSTAMTDMDLEQSDETATDIHLEMMYYLLKIGIFKGYDVWIATNDKNKSFNGESLASLTLAEMPQFTQPMTLSIAKYIDVIWFKKATVHPVRFFEIENSTSIYSGLLRFNDVRVDFPMPKATIVLPAARMDTFERQIDRPTFKCTQLYEICDGMTYEDLKQWYKAVIVDSKYS